MGHDAMANGASAAAPRDTAGAGKKKRVNRTAKLKQCKLDARREQWLSQVKNKDSKGMGMTVFSTLPLAPHTLSLPFARKGPGGAGMVDEERDGPGLHDSSDSESPNHSPTSSSSGHLSGRDRPPSSFGSGSSVESSSRTVSDAEFEEEEEEVMDGDGESGPLDDWEAVADALSVGNERSGTNPDSGTYAIRAAPGPQRQAPGRAPTKSEPIRLPPRAWRPDDISRPRSLPSLLKQRSFTVEMERQCGSVRSSGILSSHSTCPICCEDLDVTDSTFLPCSCGFHLCLFCHKRILEDNGRCPGCRKHYGSVAGTAIDVGGGGNMASVRLSRSCSMRSRS